MNPLRLIELNEINEYISSPDSSTSSEPSTDSLPDIIGILPIRNAVAFPGTVMPLAIGRARSRKLIEDASDNNSIIGLVSQINPETDFPTPNQIYRIGTIASILKTIKMPQDSVNIIVHGIYRFKITKIVATKPYIKAKIQVLTSQIRMTKKIQATTVNVRQIASRVISLSPGVPEEAAVLLENIENPSTLADFLAANLNIALPEKQKILEELNARKRLETVQVELAKQLEVLELSQKIQGQVRNSIDKSQREYFLHEQLKAIQEELGLDDKKSEDAQKVLKAIKKAKMPQSVEKEAISELERMNKLHPGSSDYSVIRTYLDWICKLPWSASTKDSISITKAQRILNRDHFGLDKVKKRILEFLAVRKLNPTGKSPILCFVGPPGVGKTSLGKSIAKAMNRKFIRISLGGMRDEADIRGHRRTYIGAMPGRILQELGKAGANNAVFMLDEMDKIGADFRGDPASAMLEVLDPEQNNTFTDHYIDQPFDLSNVMFIGTANYTDPIPYALYDRMEIIDIPGYTETEKLQIAKKYLLPRQIKDNGLKKNQITIKDDAVIELINSYTCEAGVRALDRCIAAICRHIATGIATGKIRRATITKSSLFKILGPIKFESELAMRTSSPGVATGLAWTGFGGDILFVESARIPGEGNLKLTGQLGDVMKESAQAVFTIIKANLGKFGIKGNLLKDYDYHIHVPEGAVSKDGPSAGVAIFVSLISLLTKRPVKPDVAMTGEITLRGLVLPIGGLKEKLLAAKRAGIKTVILPYRNKKDIVEVPKETLKGIKIYYIKKVSEALKIALK